ncbi:hypothetical protein PsYK624_150140 [Phanerochaete sordida]|uniref:Uncharacterized protein n=1 Tax=Phanerochaete sordida TaxID=48140 RepID=A0A9P3GN06_9APHY|nr:hypothetical protein PsYK624_150140 [Phanerochaete sordida]
MALPSVLSIAHSPRSSRSPAHLRTYCPPSLALSLAANLRPASQSGVHPSDFDICFKYCRSADRGSFVGLQSHTLNFAAAQRWTSAQPGCNCYAERASRPAKRYSRRCQRRG